MAGDPPKIAIPAWQRAKPPQQHATSTAPEPNSSPSEPAAQSTPSQDDSSEDIPAAEGSATSVAAQLDQIDALLQDPSIKEAPVESKRAFLERKSIPVQTIDTYLSGTKPASTPTDEPQIATRPPAMNTPSTITPPQPIQSSGPPIITYPEYLVDAHHPPPLITPQRVLGAAYVAGGITALLYGANQFLITPMVEALTASRHEFATHSISRLDEFNERLSKMVSKVPEKFRENHDAVGHEVADDAAEREPTELFSRDFGTQTSPPSSRRPSFSDAKTASANASDAHAESLLKTGDTLDRMINYHIDTKGREREQLSSLNKLQNYLDTMLYASSTVSPAVGMWSANEDARGKAADTRDDTVEQLKKEIRGVKGLLLSARRFPTTGAARGLT